MSGEFYLRIPWSLVMHLAIKAVKVCTTYKLKQNFKGDLFDIPNINIAADNRRQPFQVLHWSDVGENTAALHPCVWSFCCF